ncbi:ABC transporter ATP-binding protein [Orbaceae bacterium ac157xtp]
MLVTVKNLRKDYTRGKQFSAVDNVSFELEQGDFACIMGKSGSGKTTLLNMIAGIVTPTNGKISVADTDIFSLEDKAAAQFRNQTIGYVPQGSSLLPNLTGFENVCLPYYLHYAQNQKNNPVDCAQKANELFEKAGIAELKEMYPTNMSGGEIRRVAVIRALICSPKLILADEPTNDLDDESAIEIMTLFSKINQSGTTVLIVTHDSDVANYAKKQFKMAAGKLIAC